MTAPRRLIIKLEQKLRALPESERHEFAMMFDGHAMTYDQVANALFREKHIGKVKKLVRCAEEVGLIR